MMSGFVESVMSAVSDYSFLFGVTGWVIKSSLLLIAAVTLCRFLRHRPAAVKHLILRSSLLGVLVLAIVAPLVPIWQLPSSQTLPVFLPGLSIVTESSATGLPTVPGWLPGLMLVWLVGALILGIRFLTGVLGARKLMHHAAPLTSQQVLTAARQIETDLAIRQSVRYLTSSRLTLPVTWGVTTPIVILPSHDLQNLQQVEMVLRHELAHVRRRDVFWLNLTTLASVVQWFNPLVWVVKRKMQIESESACDSYVLNGDISSDRYARHVLESARTASATGRLINTCIAFNSHLEGRIMSILNGHNNRGFVIPRSLTLGVTTALLLGCLTLAGLTLESCNTDSSSSSATAFSGSQESAPSPDEFVPVDQMPEMTYMENPEYPESAKEDGVQGAVWIKALVDKEGTVIEARASKSSGNDELDQAAVDAAYQNKFKPAEQDGQPVATWITYKIDFLLEDSK